MKELVFGRGNNISVVVTTDIAAIISRDQPLKQTPGRKILGGKEYSSNKFI